MDYDEKIEEQQKLVSSWNAAIVFWIVVIILSITGLIIAGIKTDKVDVNVIIPILGFEGIALFFFVIARNSFREKLQETIALKEEQINIDKKNNFTQIVSQLAINEKTKKVRINDTIYNFKDIIQGVIVEDGNTITTTIEKRKSSIGKAIVGGALFGPAGAIIGGTAGRSVSTSTNALYCSKLEVVVTVNNLENPVEYIKIIEKNVNKSSQKYAERSEIAQKCLSVLQIIIDRKNSK